MSESQLLHGNDPQRQRGNSYTASISRWIFEKPALIALVDSETLPRWVYGAYWKFSSIVMELCQPASEKNTVRPSREAARFAPHGTGSSSWSTGVSKRVWKL